MDTHDGTRLTGVGRRFAAMALAGLSLVAVAMVATPDRAEAVTCPPGTVQQGVLCIRTNATTVPQPTTTTTPPVTAPPVTLPPVTAPPVTAPPAPAVVATDGARRLLELVNSERARAGLGALAWRDDVAAVALAHSERMAAAGDIFHSDSFFSASVKNLLNVVSRGENVAHNGSIDGAHTRLMASSGHRANILDRSFNAVGIGVGRHADGRYFITQDFIQAAGAPRPPAAPKPAPPTAPAPKPAVAPRPAPRPAAATAAPTTAAPTTVAPTTTTEAPPVVPDDAATLSLARAAPQVLTALPASASSTVGVPLVAAAVALVVVLMALACWLIPLRFRP